MTESNSGKLGARRCRVALLPDCHVGRNPDSGVPSAPTRRLYGCARQLLETYLHKLASSVDAIFLLGDTLDPADHENLNWLKAQVQSCSVPIHILIGNHETFGSVNASVFHRELGLPDGGHYVTRVHGVPFLMLATPTQRSLASESSGSAWLQSKLTDLAEEDTFCCAHYSLLLHPCVQGWRNDGMQILDSSKFLLKLLEEYPRMRAWIAGHKNVPSKVEYNGILHLLSPQLIQAPCGYRILDIYEHGISSRTYNIDESHLALLSREAYGSEYSERHGRMEDRDFDWLYPELPTFCSQD